MLLRRVKYEIFILIESLFVVRALLFRGTHRGLDLKQKLKLQLKRAHPPIALLLHRLIKQ